MVRYAPKTQSPWETHMLGIVSPLWDIPSGLVGSVQFSSVSQSWLTLCNPMNRSTPGLPVHHQLLEFTQTHVHRVSDAIQPSHTLSSPAPPAFGQEPGKALGLIQPPRLLTFMEANGI